MGASKFVLSAVEINEAIMNGEDRKVFNHLYNSCWPKIHRYIKKHNGTRAEAEDIFHDALIIFYRQFKTNQYKPQYDVDGYVFVIARNMWINYIKKKNRQEAIDEIDFPIEESILQNLISKEREIYITKLIGVLGERCKELLSLTIFHQYKLEEIKNIMGFSSVDATKTKHYKCKQRLIKFVNNNNELKKYLKYD